LSTLNQNDFNAIHSDEYEGWGFSFRESQQFRFRNYEQIISALNVRGRVLEVGCSTGYFTSRYLFPLFGDRLTATDLSNQAIAVAKKKYPLINFQVDALPALKLQPPGWDLILLIELLYYLDKDEQKRSMDRVCDLLRPGGYCLISVNIGKPNHFAVDEIEELVRAKFTIVRTKSIHLKTYYRLVEEKIWRALQIFSRKEKFQVRRNDQLLRKTAKLLGNLMLRTNFAYPTVGLLMRSLCKTMLRMMPISAIDKLSSSLGGDKEKLIYIILARK